MKQLVGLLVSGTSNLKTDRCIHFLYNYHSCFVVPGQFQENLYQNQSL